MQNFNINMNIIKEMLWCKKIKILLLLFKNWYYIDIDLKNQILLMPKNKKYDDYNNFFIKFNHKK